MESGRVVIQSFRNLYVFYLMDCWRQAAYMMWINITDG